MSLCILGPSFGNHPNSLRKIELIPGEPSDFLATLARERQELNNATVGTANLSGGENDLGELLIIQHPVASDFLRGRWHTFGGRLIQNGSSNAPAQKSLDRLQRFVGSCRCPPLFDSGDDLNYVSFADLMNTLAGPGLSNFATKEPGNLARRTVLCKTLGNEGLHQILHSVRHDPSLCLPFLGCRVATFQSRCEHLLRCHPCLVKGHAPIRADRLLA